MPSSEAIRLRSVLEQIAADGLAAASDLRNAAGEALFSIPQEPTAPLDRNPHIRAAINDIIDGALLHSDYESTDAVLTATNRLIRILANMSATCPNCRHTMLECICSCTMDEAREHFFTEVAAVVAAKEAGATC